jgi:alkylated DNA nucleotide flippase Atl1
MSDTAGYDESVLEVALLIPPGSVLTYGDIAELLECGGPRQVGAAMSRSGSAVPWWRVIRAGGHPPRGLGHEAYPRYAEEGTPLRRPARGRPAGDAYAIDLPAARWAPSAEALQALAVIRRRLRPEPGTDTAPALAENVGST